MDFLANLLTPESCENYARNVESRHPEQAAAARAKRFRLLAEKHGVDAAVAEEGYQAIYAFEYAKSTINGKRTRASRTWQKIQKVGMVATIDSIAARQTETEGFRTLADGRLLDFSFEAVVLRHKSHFSLQAVAQARKRLLPYRDKLGKQTLAALAELEDPD